MATERQLGKPTRGSLDFLNLGGTGRPGIPSNKMGVGGLRPHKAFSLPAPRSRPYPENLAIPRPMATERHGVGPKAFAKTSPPQAPPRGALNKSLLIFVGPEG